MNAVQQLESMVGRTYRRHEGMVTVKKVRLDGPITYITTDQKTHQIETSKLDTFLSEFEPITTELSIAAPATQGLQSLAEKLMADIDRLREDPAYIPQSKAINDTVRSIVGIAKTQIEAYKLSQGRA